VDDDPEPDVKRNSSRKLQHGNPVSVENAIRSVGPAHKALGIIVIAGILVAHNRHGNRPCCRPLATSAPDASNVGWPVFEGSFTHRVRIIDG
jgi:hypothetical protein